MTNVFIYALKCPETGAIRYIGKTYDLNKRFAQHLGSSKKDHRACWIHSLKSRGLVPIMETIDEVAESEWQALEAAYIEYFLEQGCDLVNATPGGESNPIMVGEKNYWFGKNRSGKNNPMFGVSRFGEKNPMFGKKHTAQSKEKNRISNTGLQAGDKHPMFGVKRTFSSEHCSKISIAAKLRWDKKRQAEVLAEMWT